MAVEATKTIVSTEDNLANKTSMVEVEIKEVEEQITTVSNAISATNRGITRRIAIPTVATTVERWDILQETVDRGGELKKRLTLP